MDRTNRSGLRVERHDRRPRSYPLMPSTLNDKTPPSLSMIPDLAGSSVSIFQGPSKMETSEGAPVQTQEETIGAETQAVPGSAIHRPNDKFRIFE